MKARFFPLALCAVAACGSSSSEMSQNEDTVTLGVGSYQAGSTGRLVAYDANAETLTFLTQGDVSVTLDKSNVPSGAVWQDYSNADFVAFVGESSTGRTAVVRAIGPGDGGLNTTEYLRQAPTEMPTSGSMTYGGEYRGMISQAGANIPLETVTGRVTMRADFADMAVTGAITNRATDFPDGALPDAVFDLGRINAVGEVSGIIEPVVGQIGDDDFYISGGFGGVISGANAEEVGGSLRLALQNEATGDRFIEYGVFIAESE